MLALIAVMLAEGAKGIFEDPAYLIGIPLLALGVAGLLALLSPLGRARSARKEKSDTQGSGKDITKMEDR